MKSFFKSVKERFIGSKSKNYPVVELYDEADSLLINSSCLHCPICYEVFGNAPGMLPCGHSFCMSCVGKLRLDAKYSPVFLTDIYECPFCRQECTITQPAMRNFAVESVLESVAENTQPVFPEDHRVANLRFTNKRLLRKVADLEESRRELNAAMNENLRNFRYSFLVVTGAFIFILARIYFAAYY